MDDIIIPYSCGLIGSLFFTAVHYAVKSKTMKDFFMFGHLIWGGTVFVPTALCNLTSMPWMTTRMNSFFAGTITPIVFSMIMRKRKQKHHMPQN